MGVKQELYKLLYEWEVLVVCDYCQHMTTYRDNDNRHSCAQCKFGDRFKIAKHIDEDLKDKVKQIINVVNSKEETK